MSGKGKTQTNSDLPFSKWTIITTIIGLVVAVVSVIFPTMLGIDSEHAILFGVIIAVTTLLADLLIEAANRIIETQDRTLEMLMLEDRLLGDSRLARRLKEMVEDYFAIKNVRSESSDYFEEVMQHYLDDCQSLVHRLSEGYFETNSYGPHSFRVRGIRFVRTSMLLVQAQDPEYWTEELGRRYTELQRGLIEDKKVNITRIWVLNEQHLADCKPVLLQHADLGIDTRVLPLEWIKDQRDVKVEDFGVIDDYLIVKPLPNGDRERISRDANEFSTYTGSWEQLHGLAIKAKEYYARTIP
jgi:hypothetical protein